MELAVLEERGETVEEKDRDDNNNLDSGEEYNTELEQRAALRKAGLAAETVMMVDRRSKLFQGARVGQ